MALPGFLKKRLDMEGTKIVVDPELLAFLKDFKRDIQASLKATEEHIRETLQLNIDPVKETIKRHTDDIAELYDFDRNKGDDIKDVAARVKVLEDNKSSRRDNLGYIVALGVAIITIVLTYLFL
jgi:septal ring factor EnvC (AmiA/AmiB activator)